MEHETTHRRYGYLRWAARILSVLYLAFFLFMFTGHVVEDWGQFLALTLREGLGFLFIGVLFVGYLLAWKRETLGGALGVFATIAFRIVIDAPILMLVAMAFPGLLFLLSQSHRFFQIGAPGRRR
jgi:hypothetical protein